PDGLASFLAELRRVFATARPTAGHRALARLEGAGLMDGVITQNVDGLHQDAGSGRVVEIHGSFLRFAGIECGHATEVAREELVAALDRAITGLRSAFVASLAAVLPPCPACGLPARPDYVAFGEPPHHFAQAEEMARSARMLLVVGTSGEVFPAAALPDIARRAGAIVVDMGPDDTDIAADLRIDGRAGEVLPMLVDRVLQGYP
ncbi:MAG TPA: Sir2 family NAD-dependent protein deacetylase, partial [Actinomycetota bacterium]|nr:Sir2 family NAD-dependent protein deacetylase [Actinomycetota bacterium]